MKISLKDIQVKFESLCNGTENRKEISSFSIRAQKLNDDGQLEIDPLHEEKIWDALMRLSMADLEVEKGTYLYSIEDFIDWKKDIDLS